MIATEPQERAMDRDLLELLPPQELRDRLRGLYRLLDAARSVASAVDLDQALESIVHDACTALECDRASLYQYDPVREELCTRVVTELEIDEIRTPLDHGITGYVARTQRLVHVPDPPSDARWNADVDRRTGYQTRNILAAPLISQHDGSLLGVLQVLNKLAGQFDGFDEELIQAFSGHAAVALDRARLVAELRERERSAESLAIARTIQRGFLPSQMPQAPGYEFALWCYPNEEVGGDYCDIMPIGDECIGLVVADVSGHGLGPSLLMASVRAAFRALLLKHAAPEELLGLLERLLADDLRDGKFVTMVVAQLDPQSHRVAFANAGHAPALHYFAALDRFMPLAATGMPVGIAADGNFSQGPPFSMEPGDLILLCTDGIVDALSPSGQHFGEERLQEIVRQGHKSSAEALAMQISQAVVTHVGDQMPSDDLTILVVKRTATR
jgi:serine phosphatase RsbU (regulator of sigma subunit)